MLIVLPSAPKLVYQVSDAEHDHVTEPSDHVDIESAEPASDVYDAGAPHLAPEPDPARGHGREHGRRRGRGQGGGRAVSETVSLVSSTRSSTYCTCGMKW